MSGMTRRSFVKSAAAAAGLAGTGCGAFMEEFARARLREMTRPEVDAYLKKLERDYGERFGKDFTVKGTPAMEGVRFGAALDLSRCIGCRRCADACVEENNASRKGGSGPHDNPVQWIRVLEMDKERGVDFAHASAYYDAETVPRPGHFYVPVSCQHCENPPCVKVCPVKATWQEPDGIVVVDYDWCIGCRYCMVACPYGARHFNWTEPTLPAEQVNTKLHVLGNRPRPQGVVEKCTFCIQRTREGRYPACVEACPVGARKFGNLLDPASEVRAVLERKRVLVLKEELNTQPKFFYFFGV